MFDRDNRNLDEAINLIQLWFKEANISYTDISLGDWFDVTHGLKVDRVDNIFSVRLLPLLIPPDGNGALEKFLINALYEQETDKRMFDKTSNLIDDIKDVSYLTKRRYRDKAQLGCILSIMSPDWVFSCIDDRLKRIEWDKLPSVLNTFEKFGQMVNNTY